MSIDIVTNDAVALTDSDLDEMASMGGAFDIGAVSKAKEDWVLATVAAHRGQAARIQLLDARAHRRNTLRAHRHDECASPFPA